MTVVTRSTLIRAPAEMIWQWITLPDKVKEWNSQFTHYSVVAATPDHVGTRYVTVEKFRGATLRNECVITEWVENKRLGFRGENSEFIKQGGYTLEPRSDTTYVTLELALEPRGGAVKKATAKLRIEKPAEIELEATLADLKRSVEAAQHADHVVRV